MNADLRSEVAAALADAAAVAFPAPASIASLPAPTADDIRQAIDEARRLAESLPEPRPDPALGHRRLRGRRDDARSLGTPGGCRPRQGRQDGGRQGGQLRGAAERDMSSPRPFVPAQRNMSSEELAELERRFLAAWNAPHRYRYLYKGRWRYALPLPWHSRLRLWWTRRINLFGCWLVDHRQFRAAKAVWRIKGYWRMK